MDIEEETGAPATAAEISRATGIDERDAAGVVLLLDKSTPGLVVFGEDGPSVVPFG